VSETVVGVLLAAGEGTRFEDGNKLLAAVEPGAAGEAEPLVRLAARPLVASVDEAVAVLGHESDRVADTLAQVEIATVHNPAYGTGQASSVATGVAWARERDADAAVFALGDTPWVSAGTYRAIVARWRDTDATIVVPEYDGQRGNPVLFDAAAFDELASVSGDAGGRELIARNPVERVVVEDPGILRDVDESADLGDPTDEK